MKPNRVYPKETERRREVSRSMGPGGEDEERAVSTATEEQAVCAVYSRVTADYSNVLNTSTVLEKKMFTMRKGECLQIDSFVCSKCNAQKYLNLAWHWTNTPNFYILVNQLKTNYKKNQEN